jgi:MoxR-like ATPase
MTALNDLDALQASIAEAVLGQDQVIRQILLGLLANGHLLLESLPGLAKTRTVKALAKHLDAKMSRIQFTPDLLPSDITGAEVLHQIDGKNQIQFQPGPLFGNLILADEINRAPAKVQAALLEAMEERQITVAGNSHALPELFIVVATRHPADYDADLGRWIALGASPRGWCSTISASTASRRCAVASGSRRCAATWPGRIRR